MITELPDVDEIIEQKKVDEPFRFTLLDSKLPGEPRLTWGFEDKEVKASFFKWSVSAHKGDSKITVTYDDLNLINS